jgi:hypothetical protein
MEQIRNVSTVLAKKRKDHLEELDIETLIIIWTLKYM